MRVAARCPWCQHALRRPSHASRVRLVSPCLRAVPPWQVNLSAVGVLIMFLSELFESVRLVRPCCRLLPSLPAAAAACHCCC